MEKPIDLIKKLETNLWQHYNSIATTPVFNDGKIIYENIKMKDDLVNELSKLEIKLREIMNTINESKRKLKSANDKSKKKIIELLGGAAEQKSAEDSEGGKSADLFKQEVNIQGYRIDAFPIEHIKDTFDSGVLFYSAKCGQFCINICGELFYGNIGRIYHSKSIKKNIKKVTQCKNQPYCQNSDCTFYHDPLKIKDTDKSFFKGDVRNFVETSSESIENLHNIMNSNNEEFLDIIKSKVMHYLIYYRLVKNNMIIKDAADVVESSETASGIS